MIAAIAILGLAVGAARAQEPGATPAPAPTQGPAQPPASDAAAQPLSLRYRLTERYGLAADPARPDQLVAYQVGSRETFREETDNPRGAPDHREITTRTVYTERPAQLGRRGEVVATVRRYDGFRILNALPPDPRLPALLKGLSLWYRWRPGEAPELAVLPPERPIRSYEFERIASEVFYPSLSALFPPRPARIGDTWKLGPAAARVLLAGLASNGVVDIEATLSAVERTGQGTELTAIIDLSGEVDYENDGKGAMRARLSFAFEPGEGAPEAAPGRPAAKADPELVEAHGYVSKLVMSVRNEIPLDENGRLLRTRIGQLHTERRRIPDADAAALVVPDRAPEQTPANSWILYDDPEGRFHFRHPQELVKKDDPIDPAPNLIMMEHIHPDGGAETVLIAAIPRDEAARNRSLSDPAAHLRNLKQELERRGSDVILGQQGWLPEDEQAKPRRRIYRIEAADKGKGKRLYLDDYIVVLGSGEVFNVQAMTRRDEHVAFRDQAEALLRTLGPGPSVPGLVREKRPAPAARPAPGGSEPARSPAPAPRPAPAAPRGDRMEPPPIPRLNDRP